MINTVFLNLLRAGVTGSVKEDIDASQVDWEAVEDIAIKQNVLPLVFDGYHLYYEKRGLQAPIEVKLRWYAACQKAERHYAEHLTVIRTMTKYLAEKNFRTMILKGYALSLYYPKPNHRPCGDIDIYCFGDFKEVDELVSTIALTSIDRTQHHHTVFKWNSIMVENHYDFYNVYRNKTLRKLDAILKNLVNEEIHEKREDMIIPSPTFSAIFSLGHVAGHFTTREINLRHLIDWYLLNKTNKDQINYHIIEKTCKDCGIFQFYKVWDKLAVYLFEQDIKNDVLSKESKLLWDEIVNPKFKDEDCPDGIIGGLIFKIRRWNANVWKLNLVYEKENVFWLFFNRLRLFFKFIDPEEELKKRETAYK